MTFKPFLVFYVQGNKKNRSKDAARKTDGKTTTAGLSLKAAVCPEFTYRIVADSFLIFFYAARDTESWSL
jgi:hypothetical protein